MISHLLVTFILESVLRFRFSFFDIKCSSGRVFFIRKTLTVQAIKYLSTVLFIQIPIPENCQQNFDIRRLSPVENDLITDDNINKLLLILYFEQKCALC